MKPGSTQSALLEIVRWEALDEDVAFGDQLNGSLDSHWTIEIGDDTLMASRQVPEQDAIRVPIASH